MSAITKPCETCEGRGHTLPFWNARTDCVDCAGTVRVPDVEATLRAENETLRRQLDALAGGQADGVLALARTLADAETTTLRAELDAARTDNARLRDVAERQSRGRRAALAGLLRMARRKVPPGPVAPPVPLDVQAAHEREVSELYATVASVTAERDAARAEVARLKAAGVEAVRSTTVTAIDAIRAVVSVENVDPLAAAVEVLREVCRG